MNFATWIHANGGVKGVSRKLNLDVPRVQTWVDKKACPRPLIMQKLVRMSKGKLSYDDIINWTAKSKSLKNNIQ